jgi:DNA modification methylase
VTPYYSDAYVTLYHGDCREVLPVEADVLVTDPPYGVEYSTSRGGKFTGSRITSDDSICARNQVLDWWWPRPAVVFGSWKRETPQGTKAVLVWDKGDHVGMGDLSFPWKPNHELIYVWGHGFSGHRGTGVLRFNAPSPNFQEQLHQTEKPLDLMIELVGKCPAGIILDPFAGSGTTLRAAKDLGRRAIGIEIEERYCEIAARRMAQEVLALA